MELKRVPGNVLVACRERGMSVTNQPNVESGWRDESIFKKRELRSIQ